MSEELKLYEIKTEVITYYLWRVWANSPAQAEDKWSTNYIPTSDEYEGEPSDPVITEVEPEDYELDPSEEDDYEEEEEEEEE